MRLQRRRHSVHGVEPAPVPSSGLNVCSSAPEHVHPDWLPATSNVPLLQIHIQIRLTLFFPSSPIRRPWSAALRSQSFVHAISNRPTALRSSPYAIWAVLPTLRILNHNVLPPACSPPCLAPLVFIFTIDGTSPLFRDVRVREM